MKTFPVTIVVPHGGKNYLRTYDIDIQRLIHEEGGGLVRYIKNNEDPPGDWYFADDDDMEDYA